MNDTRQHGPELPPFGRAPREYPRVTRPLLAPMKRERLIGRLIRSELLSSLGWAMVGGFGTFIALYLWRWAVGR